MDKPRSWLDVDDIDLILDELSTKLELANELILRSTSINDKYSETAKLAAELATYRCQVIALQAAARSARDQMRALCRNESVYGTINEFEAPPADADADADDGAQLVDPQKLPF